MSGGDPPMFYNTWNDQTSSVCMGWNEDYVGEIFKHPRFQSFVQEHYTDFTPYSYQAQAFAIPTNFPATVNSTDSDKLLQALSFANPASPANIASPPSLSSPASPNTYLVEVTSSTSPKRVKTEKDNKSKLLQQQQKLKKPATNTTKRTNSTTNSPSHSPLTGRRDPKASPSKSKNRVKPKIEVPPEKKVLKLKRTPQNRLVWSGELQKEFLTAIKLLGEVEAMPKDILKIMNIEGLTRENISSHLQKFREKLKTQNFESIIAEEEERDDYEEVDDDEIIEEIKNSMKLKQSQNNVNNALAQRTSPSKAALVIKQEPSADYIKKEPQIAPPHLVSSPTLEAELQYSCTIQPTEEKPYIYAIQQPRPLAYYDYVQPMNAPAYYTPVYYAPDC